MFISGKLTFSCPKFEEWTSCNGPYIRLLPVCMGSGPKGYPVVYGKKGWRLKHRLTCSCCFAVLVKNQSCPSEHGLVVVVLVVDVVLLLLW